MSKLREVLARTTLHLITAKQLAVPIVIGVTSAVRGDGRTTSAVNLAVSLATQTGGRTLLIDTDVYHPALREETGMKSAPTLGDYLSGTRCIDDAIVDTAVKGLSLIGASSTAPSEETVLDTNSRLTPLRRRFAEMLEELRGRFEYIVIDLPPMLEDINMEAITQEIDKLMFVVRAGSTPREELKEAYSLLDEEKILGVIVIGELSRVPSWIRQLAGA